jgi:hypothetical protein
VDRLDISKWYQCVCLPPDYTAPADACIRMAIDASPSAGLQSDESAITIGHFVDVEDGTAVALMDCIAGKFRGMALPDRIVSAMEQHHPQQVFVECNKQHGGELLVDTIRWRAECRGVETGRITTFSASNRLQAKETRIRRVDRELVNHDPPFLKIRQAPFAAKILNEVRQFTFDSGNHGRGDSCLDSLAYLCFGSAA